jgi:hypothetical protein
MTGNQSRKKKPGKKAGDEVVDMQTLFTLASKSVYTNVNE